jgi:hypothetical protein
VGNVTYKHLEGRTLVGPLSLAQWAQLLAGVVAGLTFGLYLSPLPATATVFVSCLLPGLPLAAGYGAMGLEFSLVQFVRAALRYWRHPRQYPPGGGQAATGYVVSAESDLAARVVAERGNVSGEGGRLEGLWDA